MPQESKRRAVLVAAFREGLGLAAIAAIRGPAGVRIEAAASRHDAGPAAAGEAIEALWWCRRADAAARIAAAATRRLRLGVSADEPSDAANGPSPSGSDVAAAVAKAANRLNVAVYSDTDILAEAGRVIARVDEELRSLQRAGELKSLNRSYRDYRIETSARRDKLLPYAEWLNNYKAKLIRQLATALRDV